MNNLTQEEMTKILEELKPNLSLTDLSYKDEIRVHVWQNTGYSEEPVAVLTDPKQIDLFKKWLGEK